MLNNRLSKNHGIAITILGFILIGYYTFFNYPNNSDKSSFVNKNYNASYANKMTNIVIKEFSSNGKLSKITQAKNMQSFKATGTILVEKPTIQILDKSQEPYVITADFAETSNKFDEITLNGNVKIIQNSEHENLIINTNSITFYTKTNLANTDQEVIVKYNNNLTMQSEGMTADLEKKVFTMEKDTRGVYAH